MCTATSEDACEKVTHIVFTQLPFNLFVRTNVAMTRQKLTPGLRAPPRVHVHRRAEAVTRLENQVRRPECPRDDPSSEQAPTQHSQALIQPGKPTNVINIRPETEDRTSQRIGLKLDSNSVRIRRIVLRRCQ